MIDGVKVSFISRFDALLEPAQPIDFFRFASVKDITVMVLVAGVAGRSIRIILILLVLQRQQTYARGRHGGKRFTQSKIL